MPRKAKILIADDDERTNKTVKEQLEGAGFEVVTAFDGEQAIEKLSQEKVDAAILDINMPNKNGIQVLTWVRKQPDEHIKNMEIVLFTADSTMDTGLRSPHTYILRGESLDEFPNHFKKVLNLD